MMHQPANPKLRRWVSSIAVSTVALCFIFISTAQARQSLVIDDLARDLVNRLGRQITLVDREVQFRAGDIAERETELRAPVADALHVALATALSEQGVRHSVHERGAEPLRLICRYQPVQDSLVITLGVHQLAVNGSVTLSEVNGRIKLAAIDPVLLVNSLDGLAKSLVGRLERSYPGGHGDRALVLPPVPAISGRPTLQLGRAFGAALDRALLQSETFGSIQVIGEERPTFRLKAQYTDAEPVLFLVELFDREGRLLGGARGELRRSELSPGLFSMIQDHARPVCVVYVPADKRAVPSESPTVAEVVAGIGDSLAEIDVLPTVCTEDAAGLTVSTSLELSQKKLPDGYGLMTGKLTVRLLDKGRPAGSVDAAARLPLIGPGENTRGALVEKLFTSDFKARLAEQVLAYRHEKSPLR